MLNPWCIIISINIIFSYPNNFSYLNNFKNEEVQRWSDNQGSTVLVELILVMPATNATSEHL